MEAELLGLAGGGDAASRDLRAAENGFLDKRVPPPPPAAAGRLTLNT